MLWHPKGQIGYTPDRAKWAPEVHWMTSPAQAVATQLGVLSYSCADVVRYPSTCPVRRTSVGMAPRPDYVSERVSELSMRQASLAWKATTGGCHTTAGNGPCSVFATAPPRRSSLGCLYFVARGDGAWGACGRWALRCSRIFARRIASTGRKPCKLGSCWTSGKHGLYNGRDNSALSGVARRVGPRGDSSPSWAGLPLGALGSYAEQGA